MKIILYVICFFTLCLYVNAQNTCNHPRDYAWFIKIVSKSSTYPVKQQIANREALVSVEYKVDDNGYIFSSRIVNCSNRKFKKVTLNAFNKVKNIRTVLKAGTDTLNFQYKIQGSSTPIYPQTDIHITGYGSCDKPILMR